MFLPPDDFGAKYVYCLIDPCTSRVRWVGQTFQPKKRLAGHKSDNYGPSPKAEWMRGLLASHLMPIFFVLELSPPAIARDIEKKWIAYMIKQGEPLLNWQCTGQGTSAYLYQGRPANKGGAPIFKQ